MRRLGWVLTGMLSLSGIAGCGGGEPDARPTRGGVHAPEPEPEETTPEPGEPSAVAPKPTTPPPAAAQPGGGQRVVRPPAPAPGAPPPATGAPGTTPGTPAPGTPEAVAPAPGTQKGRQPTAAPGGIVQINDHKWTVKRTLAESWMDNPYSLGNARESGNGWQLMGVKTRAAYHLGMRNGDIVLEANGHKLDTKTQLMMAYLDLKNDTVFNVTFLRNGASMTYTYQIID